jgi:guanyl-specific ribonuclease Sa
MRPVKPLILLAALVIGAIFWQRQHSAPPGDRPSPTTAAPQAAAPPARTAALAAVPAAAETRLPAFLPPEARDTLARIARGGPFEHRQDGIVFGNREGRLPPRPSGYYHEFTVETPGLDYRGARRIITGGDPPVIYYYTDDHYRTFRSFQVNR